MSRCTGDTSCCANTCTHQLASWGALRASALARLTNPAAPRDGRAARRWAQRTPGRAGRWTRRRRPHPCPLPRHLRGHRVSVSAEAAFGRLLCDGQTGSPRWKGIQNKAAEAHPRPWVRSTQAARSVLATCCTVIVGAPPSARPASAAPASPPRSAPAPSSHTPTAC
jgi:hypothetical protein